VIGIQKTVKRKRVTNHERKLLKRIGLLFYDFLLLTSWTERTGVTHGFVSERQRVSSGAEGGPKLYIVMVGLPARGKSTIATKLKENWCTTPSGQDFQQRELRRKMIHENTSFPDFFAPKNKEGPHSGRKSP